MVIHKPKGSKQVNKSFKSRHKSKNYLKRHQKGRVDVTEASRSKVVSEAKQARRNRARQIGGAKRERLLRSRRRTFPKVVTILALDSLQADSVTDMLRHVSEDVDLLGGGCMNLTYNPQKQRLTLLTPKPGSLTSVLDTVCAADLLLVVRQAHPSPDATALSTESERIMSCLLAQGLPPLLCAVAGTGKDPREMQARRRDVAAEMSALSGQSVRALPLQTAGDAGQLLRFVCTTPPRARTGAALRPVMVAEEFAFTPQGETEGRGLLTVTGHIRGAALHKGRRIVVPGLGDYTISSVSAAGSVGMQMEADGEAAVTGDDPIQWEVQRTGEMDAEEGRSGDGPREVEMGDDDAAEEEDPEADRGLVDEATIAATRAEVELERRSREDMDFPDEVDTPQDVPAKERFRRFRGLESMRRSPWDVTKDLPDFYSNLLAFESFGRASKRLAGEGGQGREAGEKVVVTLEDVPASVYGALNGRPQILYSLLPMENKLSVLSFVVQRTSTYKGTIKAKDSLVFYYGAHRAVIRPLFAEYSSETQTRHKAESFLHSYKHCMAVCVAPIALAPSPVLVFKDDGETGQRVLVATGALLTADPTKLLLKRIILSGYPFKVHKLVSTIRYMFFNPDDVRFFEPVELWTKHGRRGKILEPLGLHGYYKAQFDTALKNHDTVCMSLYRRVFPPCDPLPETVS